MSPKISVTNNAQNPVEKLAELLNEHGHLATWPLIIERLRQLAKLKPAIAGDVEALATIDLTPYSQSV